MVSKFSALISASLRVFASACCAAPSFLNRAMAAVWFFRMAATANAAKLLLPQRSQLEEVMFKQCSFKSRPARFAVVLAIGAAVAAVGGVAISAQDKYTLKVPNGLALSDFRGYEDWQVVAVSQTEELLKVMVANPIMIKAYRAGVPGNGQPFPEGSKIVKIEWKPKKNTESPFWVRVPDTLQDLFLIEKDSKKYPDTKGWAYAVFDYSPAAGTFAPNKTGTVNCGFVCHTAVAKKDYIFTGYGTR
jgi:hypothetical protein